jgi:hypothetical protein
MNKHLRGLLNPEIKERVLANILDRDKRDKKLRDRYSGPALDEFLFRLPSKNKQVRDVLELNKKEHPLDEKMSRIVGGLSRDVALGAGTAKLLKALPAFKKLANSTGIGKAIFEGAVYGGSAGSGGEIAKGDWGNVVPKALGGAMSGALLGGALGGAGTVTKGLAKSVKRGLNPSKLSRNKEVIEKIRKNLASKLSGKDFAHIRKITAEGTDSVAGGKLDTLLHNPTETTKAVADAYYQLSPKARQLIVNQKNLLGKDMENIMEDAFKRASGVGKTPNADNFVELIQKRGRAKAKPIYEEVYKSPPIVLSERIEGSPRFSAALKKVLADRNKADINKPDWQRNSPRILDNVKKELRSKQKQALKEGQDYDAGVLGSEKEELLKLIEEKAPRYKEARAVAKSYLKAAEAAEKGKEFLKTEKEAIPQILKGLDDNQRLAYRLGALQERLAKVRTNAQNAEFGDISRHISNPEIAKKLDLILPKGKAETLQKDVNKVKKAIDSMKEFTAGSNTAKHESNKDMVDLAVRAIAGGKRAKVGLIKQGINALKGVNSEAESKSVIKALLNPKTLLKYEGVKLTPQKKYAGKVAGLYNTSYTD